MKRLAAALLAVSLLCAVFPGLAGRVPFREDYAGINQAAASVLMLWVYDVEQKGFVATGSGFVAFDGSTLITNYHVLEGGEHVLAESDEGRSYFLDTVVAADKGLDIAILRFKSPTKLAPLTLDTTGERLRGQPVVAIGSPEGFRNTVSKGDISALFTEDGVRYIQFTAPISHGSSGGALFNDRGEVIGITTSSMMGDSQNLNFAVDIREAAELYQYSSGSQARPLKELDSQAVKPEGEPQKGQDPGTDVTLSGLSAVQTAPDAVRLSWNSLALKGQTYHIGYEVEGNPYYYFLSTQETSALIENLVPGKEYRFYAAMSEEGLGEPLIEKRLRMRDALPYTGRDARVLALGVYPLGRGQIAGVPLPPAAERLSVTDLDSAGRELDLVAVYRLDLKAAAEASIGKCQYVLVTPEGYVYSSDYRYNYEARAGSCLRQAPIDDMLDEIREYEGAFMPGEWALEIYHDGALLGKTVFLVEEGGLTPQAAAASALTGQAEAAPLVLGEMAHVGTSDNPYIDPELVSQSGEKTIAGVTLAYYCEDDGFKALDYEDSGSVLTEFSFDLTILPGGTASPGKVSLKGYGPGARYVYTAVTEIRFADGEIIKIPQSRWEFSFWQMD